MCIYVYIYLYIYIYIYIYIYLCIDIDITSKEWSIKRGFTFDEEQNVIFTMPEDCASMKLRFIDRWIVLKKHYPGVVSQCNIALLNMYFFSIRQILKEYIYCVVLVYLLK